MRALIVDDSKAVRTILRRFLTELGLEVAEAAHGKEGLETLKKGPEFNVVLIDWNMPEMGGLDFIRAVRAQKGLAGLKLLVVTSETEIGRVAEAMEAGAEGYVLKPLTRETLREKMAALWI